MSWHGGTGIFRPVCEEMVKQVRDEGIDPIAATAVLTVLIKALRDSDWGDPEEGLAAFSNVDYVVDAFTRNGISDDVCEDCGELYDEHCGECEQCDCVCDEDDAEDEYEGEEEQALVTKDK